jgi:hypothetical protein
MTTEVTPDATDEKVTPPANDAIDSLIPPDDAAPEKETALIPTAEELTAEEKAAADKAAADAVAAAAEPKWHYADGTPGKGEPPEWFKKDKYVTVEQQAKAYTELEKRFGAFVGAPKDGKYELVLPEGVSGEFEPGHPLLDKFQKFAAKSQLNQEGFSEVIGMLAEYEAMQAPDIGEIKKQIGTDADVRIKAVATWAKANLDANGFNELRAVLATKEAATTFRLLESIVNKTRQVALPKPGQDVPAGQPVGLAAIQAFHNKKGPNGESLYQTNQEHREKVEKMYAEHFQGQTA